MSALCPSGDKNTPGLTRGETPLLFALVGLLAVNQGSHEGSGLITFPKALRSPQERDRSLAWKLSPPSAHGAQRFPESGLGNVHSATTMTYARTHFQLLPLRFRKAMLSSNNITKKAR